MEALSGAEWRRLASSGETVRLSLGQVLYKQGDVKRYVYFPTDSYISQISTLAGSPRLEVGLIGAEGMAGASVVLGVKVAPLHTLVQGAGTAFRVQIPQFVRGLARSPPLREVINRYLYVRLSQLGQMPACTRFHLVEARLARWILMTRDRAHSDSFQMTHEYLAFMLGVRRASVTQAAARLQKRGLIRYSRGAMVIVNGRGLETASCECYATAERVYAQHMN